MNRIDQLLNCMDMPELPVGELAPERISGITEETFKLMHAQTKKRAQHIARYFCRGSCGGSALYKRVCRAEAWTD